MRRAESAPSGKLRRKKGKKLGDSRSSTDDWGVGGGSSSGEDLPSGATGVSPVMAARLRHDSTLNPAVLDLRMNYRNLLNEMNQHRGQLISHNLSLMKPRRRLEISSPPQLSPIPQGCDPHFLKRMASKQRARERRLIADAARERMMREKADVNEHLVMADDDDGYIEEVREPTFAMDPTFSTDVQRLAQDQSIKSVHAAFRDPPHQSSALMPYGRIPRALEALGYHDANPLVVEGALKSLARDASALRDDLTVEELCVIISSLKQEREEVLRQQFHALDDDGSGTISAREFKRLLWDLGYTVSYESVLEIIAEVDQDRSGYVEQHEFEAALYLVHDRHGFTRTEMTEIFELFDRYDSDDSGEISADELASALGWFGAPTSIAQARGIVRRFNDDAEGTLSRAEFLLVMRARLEEEISDMRALFAEFDRNSTGTMTSAELVELFLTVGYTIPREVIEEGICELKNTNNAAKESLVFEDVLRLLNTIRKREGFSIREVQELNEVHQRFDGDGHGELREFEMARALNWLGYPISAPRRRQLWCKVDVDKSDSMDQGEFLKCVRLLREEEIEAAKALLSRYESESIGTGQDQCIREQDLTDLLNKLGYAPERGLVMQALKLSADSNNNGAVDLLGILNVLRYIREGQVTKLRQSAGLPDHVANKIRAKWNMRMEAGKRIDPAEFERFLINDLFKTRRSNSEQRTRIQTLMRENCKEGGLDLSEAFWLVRLYSDAREEDAWRREQEAAASAGFSPTQVANFRKAFVESDKDGSGELSEVEIQTVFDGLMALSMLQVHRLHCELSEASASGKAAIDFPEFLRLMGIIVGNSFDKELDDDV